MRVKHLVTVSRYSIGIRSKPVSCVENLSYSKHLPDNAINLDVGGAMVFAQESIKTFFEHHGEASLAEGAGKKGTLIFTGTCNGLRYKRPDPLTSIGLF